MRWLWLALLVLAPDSALAEEWTRLDDTGIAAALNDRTLRYDASTIQSFSPSGATRYVTDRVSNGRWAARGGQYCSVWPPSDTWACYDVELSDDGAEVRFIASDESISQGHYIE